MCGLDRLSRSVAELGPLVRWSQRNSVRLIALDIGLDTAEEAGRTAARALADVGDWERQRLSERTRKGLEAARSKRHAGDGSGRGEVDYSALRKRIAAMRTDGMTLQAIADTLNAEGVPTVRGGREWRPSSVQTAAGYRRRSRARTVADLPAVAPPRAQTPRLTAHFRNGRVRQRPAPLHRPHRRSDTRTGRIRVVIAGGRSPAVPVGHSPSRSLQWRVSVFR